ncbi:solute symporter family protein [Tautonia sociabilis]|uniref:Cation acetate symporter n=1 Tax=Tautonia sociabilis TaxID=2080755 RepID=A0A432MNV2_9BACT|nr:cation acetate symporter [Tautonia sociabilis]RUL89114.1 cation acetate symporter [Tautonia sociabilis]
MIYEPSAVAVVIFAAFVAVVLGLSVLLGRRAKSSGGYFAAHGQIHWFVNGVAFAGDYLSAASFLGICGMIAFSGYDGFLYSIGYLAGWIVALFVIAEPLKRLGRFTFADALNARYRSRGITLAAALSTLVVSVFYLIPQMVGAGTLVRPLLGLSHAQGVLAVGAVVVLIVVTAGMVSTTYVQFIKGALLVLFCAALTLGILRRGLSTEPSRPEIPVQPFETAREDDLRADPGLRILPEDGPWEGERFLRVEDRQTGVRSTWYRLDDPADQADSQAGLVAKAQTLTVLPDGTTLANGIPQGTGEGQGDLLAVGSIASLPGGVDRTGPLGPISFLTTLQDSTVVVWKNRVISEDDGTRTTVYYPVPTSGGQLLVPGGSPTFSGIRGDRLVDKLDFLSLMLALFCGTASLPHILIRYYTVEDQKAARRSTVVGIASIGAFYVLTLYLGLGAMTGGVLDPTNSNMAAPLLARSFGELPFAIISAVAFTTVLGTVSGLILAASGAVAHDLMENVLLLRMTDAAKVRAAKIAAVLVGIAAMGLGIAFEKLNVSFLVGWAFNVAASANLPSLVMLLFWPKTTKRGIAAAIVVGMLTSLGWILLSAQAYKDVYRLPAEDSVIPFSQPGLVTIPLGFLVLVVVSLLTQPKADQQPNANAG